MLDPSSRRLHALGLLGLGSIMAIMMTTPVLSLYLDRRGLPTSHIGAIIGVMSLALVVAELLALGVTTRVGRRRAILIALIGSAVMLAGFPRIVSLAGLYLNRVVFGAVRGVLWPVMFAEVAEHGPPDRRGASFALFWLYFGVGTLLGPALGGLLGDRLALVAPFYAAAAVSALMLPLAMAVRLSRDPGPANPFSSYGVLLRTSPQVAKMWGITVCNVTVYSLYLTFLPLHAAARGLSAAQIGLIFTGGALAFILGQDLMRRLSSRLPAERLLIPGLLVRALGVAIVPWLSSFWVLLLVNFVTAILGAAIPLALSTRIASEAPRDSLIPAMGGFNAAADLGFFLGPLVGGILAGLDLSWAFLMAVPATLTALMLVRGTLRSQ